MGSLMGVLFGTLIIQVNNYCKPEWQNFVYTLLGITFFCYIVDICTRTPRSK